MSDQFGVYLSIRTPEGALLSSFRSSWAEVRDDISVALGTDSTDRIVASLRGDTSAETDRPLASVVSIASPPSDGTMSIASPPSDGTMTPAEVEEALTAEQAPEQTFETCNICGSLKDNWVNPGVKNGKAYKGFWGCGNFRNHPKR